MGKDDVDSKAPMMNTRISSEMIRPFSGEGDVVVWLKKVELVAKLTQVKDEASFIPLYLEGGALSVYMEMEETDQQDAKKIKSELKKAFSDSMFVAYSKMISCRWSGESVDVYANELRRLAGLAGFQSTEHVVKLAFVTGFPDDVSVELQQMNGIGSASLAELISRARILVANRSTVSVVAAGIDREQGKFMAAHQSQAEKNISNRSKGNFEHKKGFNGKCFECQGPHMVRNCPTKGENKRIICYRCGEEGHIAPKCTAQKSENY